MHHIVYILVSERSLFLSKCSSSPGSIVSYTTDNSKVTLSIQCLHIYVQCQVALWSQSSCNTATEGPAQITAVLRKHDPYVKKKYMYRRTTVVESLRKGAMEGKLVSLYIDILVHALLADHRIGSIDNYWSACEDPLILGWHFSLGLQPPCSTGIFA